MLLDVQKNYNFCIFLKFTEKFYILQIWYFLQFRTLKYHLFFRKKKLLPVEKFGILTNVWLDFRKMF